MNSFDKEMGMHQFYFSQPSLNNDRASVPFHYCAQSSFVTKPISTQNAFCIRATMLRSRVKKISFLSSLSNLKRSRWIFVFAEMWIFLVQGLPRTRPLIMNCNKLWLTKYPSSPTSLIRYIESLLLFFWLSCRTPGCWFFSVNNSLIRQHYFQWQSFPAFTHLIPKILFYDST